MNISITTIKSEGVGRTLQISVPSQDVEEAETRAARKYASRAQLPGFRPGKAPAAMVRKKFAEAIRSEALDTLVQSAYKEVLEREKINVAGQPHIHELEFKEGMPLTFQLHVEVAPEVNLTAVSGFRVTRPPTNVTNEQVEEQLEHMRDQKATWTPVADRAELGDMVKVELSTTEQGKEMPAGQEYSLTLGAGQAIPGVEELILETSVGNTTERPVKWPDDFPDEEQRSTTKTVRVKLLEAKHKTPPALDDSFAREVGDFDDLKALRQALRADLQGHAERTADAEVRQKLLDELIGANPFDVPKSWVAQLVRGYAESYQIPEADFEKFGAEFWPMAERQVRRDLVIETLAKQEKLAASEADVDARVTEVAAKRNSDAGQVYASLQKGGRMKELERGITEDKVFAWLLERNTVE
jgi:trigger factor